MLMYEEASVSKTHLTPVGTPHVYNGTRGLESEKEPSSPSGELSEFCEWTSTHGPNHIKRVQTTPGKVAWSLVTFIFSCLLVWQISLLFIKFISREYNVLMDVKFDRSQAFPAVTICNLNAYRCECVCVCVCVCKKVPDCNYVTLTEKCV